MDAGATCSTHLGNGAHAVMRRHPNYVWDQLAEDRLAAGFIFDGHHLPPSVMRSVVRAKGVERSILVSDAVSVAGMVPGRYRLFDDIEVELRANGRLELTGTPLLAGATTAIPTCIANAVRYADVTLRDAVRMVTANPSRVLGLAPGAGHERLAAGMTADLSLFRVSPDGEIARSPRPWSPARSSTGREPEGRRPPVNGPPQRRWPPCALASAGRRVAWQTLAAVCPSGRRRTLRAPSCGWPPSWPAIAMVRRVARRAMAAATRPATLAAVPRRALGPARALTDDEHVSGRHPRCAPLRDGWPLRPRSPWSGAGARAGMSTSQRAPDIRGGECGVSGHLAWIRRSPGWRRPNARRVPTSDVTGQ